MPTPSSPPYKIPQSNVNQLSTNNSKIQGQSNHPSQIKQSNLNQVQSNPSSKIQQSNLSQKSIQNSNIQKQSNPPYNSQQMNINQLPVHNSKVQKSYMTYQQSHIVNNESKIGNPQFYNSQVYNNIIINNENPISDSININNSSNKQNNKPLYINGKQIATVTKIENQSDMNNNSNINNINDNTQSIHLSNPRQSNESYKSKNTEGSVPIDTDINKDNNSAFNPEKPSFPTKSYAGKINSKEMLPSNPFEDQNNPYKKYSSMINDNNQIK